MTFFWHIPETVQKQIRHLPPDLKRQVRNVLDSIKQKSEAGKPLEEDLAGYRSYRIGRYRLIYRIDGDGLVLKALGSRRDIYERLVLEIGRQKIRERTARYRKSLARKSKATVTRSGSV